MQHFVEIAQRLLPVVQSAADDAARNAAAAVLARLCQGSLEARNASAAAHARRTFSAWRAPQHPTRWRTAENHLALEILADVVAQHPGEASDALAAVPDWYPPSLEYLVLTACETARPHGRAKSMRDRLWWYVWTPFAASEYADLLIDRHERVAKVLADASSWHQTAHTRRHRATPADEEPKPPAVAAERVAVPIEEHLDARESRGSVADRCRDAWDKAATYLRGSRPALPSWREVVHVLLEGGPPREAFLKELRQELLLDVALVRRLADAAAAAVPAANVLDAELQEILESRRRRLGARAADPPSHRSRYAPALAADMNLFGLALSGGGIRSATFNLGVLHALARIGLLRRVDYLSTVSGGGYIGAWLTTWIKRAHDAATPGVLAVERRLAVEPLPDPEDPCVRSVRFLREYSNYLTPRPGFFSADTWTMIAIWLRNTLLNQTVLVLTMAGVLSVPWLAWFALPSQTAGGSPAGLEAAPLTLLVGAAILAAVAWSTGRQLERFHLKPDVRAREAHRMLDQGGVLAKIVVPLIVAVWLLGGIIYRFLPHFARDEFRLRATWELSALFFVCLALVAWRAHYTSCFYAERIASRPRAPKRTLAWALLVIALAIGLPSVGGALLIVKFATVLAGVKPAAVALPLHWMVLSVPVLVSVMSLMIVLKLGVLGRNLFDEHREWWSRLGAWLNIFVLGWIVLFVFAIYAPAVAELARDEIRAAWPVHLVSGGIWAAWTAAGVLLGKSEQTPAVRVALQKSRLRRWIVSLAPYVFIIGLLGLVATGVTWLLVGSFPSQFVEQAGPRREWLIAGPAALLTVAFLFSCRIDVNEFSMHHFYKNRLVRCYLGASRDRQPGGIPRSPDPFTGFDAGDDLDLADLRVSPCGQDDELRSEKANRNTEILDPYIGPLPIVNTTLNLVKGDDLAWQERKAQSFAFTPLYSGYDYGGAPQPALADRFTPYGFRPTPLYGYPPFGIGLGTAVAISGAAASPNMGYHSSAAAAFLMTMFNARLGWWMGNPRDRHNWLRSGPRRGLLYLLNELFGLTNDRSHFVNLSDGGHFENLGIYELVRRRCRFIIACDAEQDQDLAFNGLGNAIRKCRTDFGAEIAVRATRIRPPAGSPESTLHCVVGEIRYPDGEQGTLLYLKASLTGDEPADVLEYKARQPSFPHHSTLGDQFFDESQFESYRKLGFHVAEIAFDTGMGAAADLDLDDRFDALKDYWYPPSAAVEKYFSGHVAHYETLLERARKEHGFEFMDRAFFALNDPVPPRAELFGGASMLALMERVFVDLDLERDCGHPHNQGWMTIFARWISQPAVSVAWDASRHSYSRRFQRFVDALKESPEAKAAATRQTDQPS